ncbi:MBL fold metallo-hydrolase [uncultured Dialister sp.]|jgi:hydroxyacylglutathione hydrolase|uniref:MBL fold metallo-hydrolase n=1 Tax=uncultured Dialister sp. TaxID=278064 RepID=UPI0025E175EA|nr:MBL fold metallo-hydrolase [uncultured Dialister sp.]
MMKIMYMVLGPFMTNTYILYNEETMEGLVVDPSFSPEQYIKAIEEKKIHLTSIFLTHAHVDHMAGMNELRKAFPEARMYMDKRDRPFLRDPEKNLSYMFPTPTLVDDADVWVKDGDEIETSGYTFQVIDTAGHTPGGISFYLKKEGIVFTGDSLFQGSIGRTDFPGGSMKELTGSIRKNLFTLPDSTVVLSGHGEQTTIGQEKRTNPFLTGGIL